MIPPFGSGESLLTLCYVKNLAWWLLAADRAVRAAPSHGSRPCGVAYFVSNDSTLVGSPPRPRNESIVSSRTLSTLLSSCRVDGRVPAPGAHVPMWLVYALCIVSVALDKLTRGRKRWLLLNVNPGSVWYTVRDCGLCTTAALRDIAGVTEPGQSAPLFTLRAAIADLKAEVHREHKARVTAARASTRSSGTCAVPATPRAWCLCAALAVTVAVAAWLSPWAGGRTAAAVAIIVAGICAIAACCNARGCEARDTDGGVTVDAARALAHSASQTRYRMFEPLRVGRSLVLRNAVVRAAAFAGSSIDDVIATHVGAWLECSRW